MDDQKNKILIAVLVFNLFVMGFQFFFNWSDDFSWLKFGLSLILGAAAGGGAFVAAAALKK